MSLLHGQLHDLRPSQSAGHSPSLWEVSGPELSQRTSALGLYAGCASSSFFRHPDLLRRPQVQRPLGTVCLRRKTGPGDSAASIASQTQIRPPLFPLTKTSRCFIKLARGGGSPLPANGQQTTQHMFMMLESGPARLQNQFPFLLQGRTTIPVSLRGDQGLPKQGHTVNVRAQNQQVLLGPSLEFFRSV